MMKCENCVHNEELDEDLIVTIDMNGFNEIGCELNIPGYPNLKQCVHWYQFPDNGE